MCIYIYTYRERERERLNYACPYCIFLPINRSLPAVVARCGELCKGATLLLRAFPGVRPTDATNDLAIYLYGLRESPCHSYSNSYSNFNSNSYSYSYSYPTPTPSPPPTPIPTPTPPPTPTPTPAPTPSPSPTTTGLLDHNIV